VSGLFAEPDKSSTDGPFASIVLHCPTANAESTQAPLDNVTRQLAAIDDPSDLDRLEVCSLKRLENGETFAESFDFVIFVISFIRHRPGEAALITSAFAVHGHTKAIQGQRS
jgi:hypothetical protein